MKGVLSLISIFLVLVLSGRCSDVYSRNDFPKGFSFGSATSAYQWEGAAGEDGKKPSVWDTFLHSRNLCNLDNGDIACDGYHKYKEMQGGCVGFSIFTIGFTPSTSSKDDEIAVQRAKDLFFGWMLGPLIFGDYPDEMKRTVGSRLPVFSLEESEQVKGSSDFIGIIHYLAASVTSIKFKPFLSGHPDFYSDIGASMTCRPLKQDLQLQQKDTPRIDYLHAYIGAVLKSIRNGSDTRGYFVWSFMDLYELLRGYEFSFGLYSVNFSDPYRNRSPKLSAYWYTSFLKGNTTFLGSQATMRLQSNFSSSVSS
uniref:Sinigrinase n=1 Tax=Brassica campestris TaxID=3711 RepID=M4DWG4_BRACM